MSLARTDRGQTGSQRVPEIRLFENALPGELFERLAEAVRDIGNERLKRTYMTTFWFPLAAEVTNVAEETIRELRAMVQPPGGCTGCEWWLGRLRDGQKLRYHFDRDLTLRKQTGELAHPLYASVLYLNTFPSSPTVVLDQVPSPDGETRIPAKPTVRNAFPAVRNHYVVFPGNRRHGVIPRARRADGSRGGDPERSPEWRLTLLVNYWERRPLPPVCIDYDGSIYGRLRDEPFFASGRR